MNVLFIGDPHLKITRFDLALQFLGWVTSLIERVQPDIVVNLGDTFHTHAVVRSELLSEFQKHVIESLHHTEEYIYVLGNHDMFKPKDAKYHALQTINMAGLTIIDKVTDYRDITWVPFLPNEKEFPVETRDICVAHQTFIGCDYGGFKPEYGVDADKISAEVIISGHIHKRQKFGKVIYPGTPFAQDINDINQSKGVMTFDTESYKSTFHESPLPKYRGARFDISSDIHNLISNTVSGRDHWVIEISGPRAEVNAYIDSAELALLRQKHDIRMKPYYTDKNKTKVIAIKSNGLSSIVSEYVDKVYDGTLDKGIIKDRALKTLQKIR